MPKTPILHGENVVLDALAPEDAPAMVAADDEDIRREWGRTDPLNLGSAGRRIAAAVESWEASGPLRRWAVRSLCDRRFIGTVALSVGPTGRGALVEAWIARADREARKGSEAVGLACDYGFDTIGLRYIDAKIKHDNCKSQGLATLLGFRRVRDEMDPRDDSPVYVYRVFRSDWRPAAR